MCKHRFNYSKCTTLVRNVGREGGCAKAGLGYMKFSIHSARFGCEPITAQKRRSGFVLNKGKSKSKVPQSMYIKPSFIENGKKPEEYLFI